MRILQIGKFYPIKGGVEKVMYDLMEGLSQRGCDCDMLCAASKGPGFIKSLNAHARLICCHAWAKLAATMISPAMIFTLRRECRKYDILHVHHPDPMAALATLFSGFKGKVVLHWHSDIEKQKFLLKLYRPLQSWLLRRADLIVGTSPVYLAESPYLQAYQDKTRCIPIGIDPIVMTDEAIEEFRCRYPGKKIVFSLGRLVTYKGYKYLVEAARYLPDDYIILIGGEGPLREELLADIDRWNLQDKVKLLGRISDEELPHYFGACDIFCMSSIYKTEAFAIAQIEAMSCGKPIVSTKIPHSGVSWVNAHERSGLSVPSCDAQALADAIHAIGSDPSRYERLSRGAKARYHEKFTKEDMINSTLKMYKNLWRM